MSGSRRAPTLIAVHVPKTAGTSFRVALEAAYGDGLELSYGPTGFRPPRAPLSPRRKNLDAMRHAIRHAGQQPPAAAIYGHFMPAKFRWARNVRFSIWLRDPVPRLVSRYRHYLRESASNPALPIPPNLSLTEFAQLGAFQDRMHKMLWGFPLERFDFIGLTENYETDLQRFATTFGIEQDLPVTRVNVSNEEVEASAADLNLIARLNPNDMALYANAQRLVLDQRSRHDALPS